MRVCANFNTKTRKFQKTASKNTVRKCYTRKGKRKGSANKATGRKASTGRSARVCRTRAGRFKRCR